MFPVATWLLGSCVAWPHAPTRDCNNVPCAELVFLMGIAMGSDVAVLLETPRGKIMVDWVSGVCTWVGTFLVLDALVWLGPPSLPESDTHSVFWFRRAHRGNNGQKHCET